MINDYYNNYYYLNGKQISERFKIIFKELKKYSDEIYIKNMEGVNICEYDNDMYNSQRLVLGYILEKYSDIGKITVKWKNSSESLITIKDQSVKK